LGATKKHLLKINLINTVKLRADVVNYASISEKLDPEEVHKIIDEGCKLSENRRRIKGNIDRFRPIILSSKLLGQITNMVSIYIKSSTTVSALG